MPQMYKATTLELLFYFLARTVIARNIDANAEVCGWVSASASACACACVFFSFSRLCNLI